MCFKMYHFCHRNSLMYVQKKLQCGDFLPFSSLEFKSMDAENESLALNDIFLHFCQALQPSLYQLLAVTFQSSQRSEGSCLCFLVIGKRSLFQLSTNNFGSREDDKDTEG